MVTELVFRRSIVLFAGGVPDHKKGWVEIFGQNNFSVGRQGFKFY